MAARSSKPHRARALRAVALCAAALSIALAACGGASDEDTVKKAVALNFLSNDPGSCDSLYTENLIDQLFGSGDAGISACKAIVAKTTPAASVDVSDVQVDGDNATATATVTGGSSDGGVYSIELVKDGDSWKYDSLDVQQPPKAAKK